MAETQKTCPTCLKPYTAPTSGFVTQFLGVCRCAEFAAAEAQSEVLPVCATCGKEIGSQRAGSMTQWVFRADRCGCEQPVPIQPSANAYTSREIEELDLEQCEELPVRRGNFPIERYKPIAKLGAGASGEVFLAADRMLNKKVAVKVLHEVTSQQLIAFQSEARVTSKLKHPATIQVLDFGPTETGKPYMVLEYLDRAVSLEQFIQENGPLSVDLAITVFYKVCEGLAHAHEMHVLHRDLKPSNVLLSDTESGDPQVKLIDFGVATFKKESQEPTMYQGKTIVGTPAYMAPEQIGDAVYDERSEVYSCGCLMFETLTGRPPFLGETALETMSCHVNKTPPTMQEVSGQAFPKELEALVARCLSKKPEDRPPNVGTVKRKLLTIQSKAAQQAGSFQPSVPEELKETVGGGNRKAVVVGAVALLALALLALALLAVPFMIQPKPVEQPKKRTKVPQLEIEKDEVFGHQRLSKSEQESLDSEMYGEQVVIEGRKLDQTFPLSLSHKNIARIKIKSSEIADSNIMQSIGNCESAQSIKFINCTGLTPRAIQRLAQGLDLAGRSKAKQGFWLDFSGSDIDDEGLTFLTKQSKMRALILTKTLVTDNGLKTLSGMKKLRALDVSETAVTSKGLESLKAMPLLILLRAFNCPKVVVGELKLGPKISITNEPFHLDTNIEFALNSQAAQLGNVEAQWELGTRYHTGDGVNQNYDKALFWYKKAAEQGNILAANNLGSLYMYGQGVPRDGKEAMKWFRIGEKQNEKTATNNVGVIYLEGNGFPKDYAKAVGYFKRSAEQGFPEAQNNLGVCYQHGYGVKQDYVKARDWYEKAAGQESKLAIVNLGGLYENGLGVPQDSKAALRRFQQAADMGSANGQFYVGVMYFSGHGVKKDLTKAVEWFELAAEQNDTQAQLNLGQVYFYGQGVLKDRETAVNWYRKAANQGLPMAQVRLGQCYEQGQGVEKDVDKAIELYKAAAQAGEPSALKALKELQQ